MFDYIGELVRAGVLSQSPWISRCAGLAEPVPNADGGFYPGARPYAGQPCDAVGDYINMAPSELETCIAFVDQDSEVRQVYSTSKLYDFEVFFRVVVWFDERKVTADAGNLMILLQSGITAGVLAVSFNTPGMSRTKTFFDSVQIDPKTIWSRYQIDQEKHGLFLLPYRTLAIRFRLIGRVVPACFTGEIAADATAC